MGLHTKHIFLSSTIREFAGKHNAICIKIRFPQRWTGCGWISRKAGLLPCLFDVGGSAGVPPGGGGVWRPRGGPAGRPSACQTKERGRGQRPRARSFRALRALPPPPPVRWNFHRPKRSIHHPFPPRLPIKKPSPPLPMSGPPAYSAGNPEKFSSRFSPAFFKSGPGVWGRSPQRGPGAAPLTGSRGSAPAAVPRHATRNRRQAFWKVASSSSAREHWWSSASFWAMRGRKVESLRWPRWGTGVM